MVHEIIESATNNAMRLVQQDDRGRAKLARLLTNSLMQMHQDPKKYEKDASERFADAMSDIVTELADGVR